MKQKSHIYFWFDLPSVVYFSMSNCPTVQQRCWGTDFQTVDTSLGWSFGLGDSPKQRRRLDPQRRTDLDEVWKWRCGSGETQRLGIQKWRFLVLIAVVELLFDLTKEHEHLHPETAVALRPKTEEPQFGLEKFCEWCTSKPIFRLLNQDLNKKPWGTTAEHKLHYSSPHWWGNWLSKAQTAMTSSLSRRTSPRAPHWAAVLASCWSASRWADTSTRQHDVSRFCEKISSLSKRPSTFALAKAEVIWEARSST